MKHTFETRVYYSDTDAYGVVWHGSYLRWLEKGRVEFCNSLGLDLTTMQENDILMPVTTMNVKYKASAKLNDVVIIDTWVEKYNSLSITFRQTIKSLDTQKLYIDATFDVVAVTNAGKLYRRLPEFLSKAMEKGLEKCPALV